jgi:hypothetical protein
VIEAIKNNPVRLYGILVTGMAIVTFYLPDLPTALLLAFLAAILGVGEKVRANVTPMRNVEYVSDPADEQLSF